MKLYHYTTIESFLKIWVSKTILFSESSNVNDIYERHKIHSFVDGLLPTSNGEEYFEALKNVSKIFTKILKKYKQISFTIDSKKAQEMQMQ